MRLLVGADINDQIVANDQAVIFKNGTFWDNRNEPFGVDDKAVFVNGKPKNFIDAIAQHRNWDRMEAASDIPV